MIQVFTEHSMMCNVELSLSRGGKKKKKRIKKEKIMKRISVQETERTADISL